MSGLLIYCAVDIISPGSFPPAVTSLQIVKANCVFQPGDALRRRVGDVVALQEEVRMVAALEGDGGCSLHGDSVAVLVDSFSDGGALHRSE